MNDLGNKNLLLVRHLARTDYQIVYDSMKEFARIRSADTKDELWITEHDPVFTQGQSGKPEHLIAPGDIPVIQSNRGGQITYHGPGQIVAYLLFDISRMNLSVREFVRKIELSMMATLNHFDIRSNRMENTPGVYVRSKKIGSLGLRISRGNSYHGLSLNVDMDTEPFGRIHPCGMEGLEITTMCDFGNFDMLDVTQILEVQISREFGFKGVFHKRGNLGL